MQACLPIHVMESSHHRSRIDSSPFEETLKRVSIHNATVARWEQRKIVNRREEGMPQTPHVEHHFTAGETVRDIVIGMSDGLTVPFALAAGLSGAVSSTSIVIKIGRAHV